MIVSALEHELTHACMCACMQGMRVLTPNPGQPFWDLRQVHVHAPLEPSEGHVLPTSSSS